MMHSEKKVILLKNGAKFVLDKEPFKVILSSPEDKNGYFNGLSQVKRRKQSEKPLRCE